MVVCWMYWTCVVMGVDPKRAARTFVLLCVHLECLGRHARTWRCYWWLMQYEVVISPLYTLQWRWHLLHIIMANTALRWSSFAECMERFLGCPWMNSVYVTSLCVYACIGLCQWCFMQYAVAFPRSCAPLLSDGNDALRWSSCANLWNNGCRIDPKQTACTFTLLFVRELEGVSY